MISMPQRLCLCGTKSENAQDFTIQEFNAHLRARGCVKIIK
jgi:hypothetical protein